MKKLSKTDKRLSRSLTHLQVSKQLAEFAKEADNIEKIDRELQMNLKPIKPEVASALEARKTPVPRPRNNYEGLKPTAPNLDDDEKYMNCRRSTRL